MAYFLSPNGPLQSSIKIKCFISPFNVNQQIERKHFFKHAVILCVLSSSNLSFFSLPCHTQIIRLALFMKSITNRKLSLIPSAPTSLRIYVRPSHPQHPVQHLQDLLPFVKNRPIADYRLSLTKFSLTKDFPGYGCINLHMCTFSFIKRNALGNCQGRCLIMCVCVGGGGIGGPQMTYRVLIKY